MSATWLAVRSRLRSGWRSSLALVLLIGFGGGVTLAALAGARRSDSALTRFVDRSRTSTVAVFLTPATTTSIDGFPDDPIARRALEADAVGLLRDLPEVAAAARGITLLAAVPDPSRSSGWRITLAYAPMDADIVTTFGRPIVVKGRVPRGDRPYEVAVNEELAARNHLDVGSTLRVGLYAGNQFTAVGNGAPLVPGAGQRPMEVTGILRYPPDVLPVNLARDDLAGNHAVLWFTPSYWRQAGPDVATYGAVAMVRLRRDVADVARLRDDVRARLDPRVPISEDTMVGYNVEGVQSVAKATDVESLAMAAFATLTGLATALLLWQALRRQLSANGADGPALAALGMQRRDLTWAAALSATWIGLLGGLAALAAALLLSPLTPIGVARRMEIDHGVHADWDVLLLGAVLVAVLVVVVGAITGWEQPRGEPMARRGGEAPPSSSLSRAVGATSLPLSVATGLRLALVRGRGRWAVPVSTLLAGAVLGVAAAVASSTFAAGLAHLASHPRLYGATADASVGNYADPKTAAEGARLLDAQSDVAGYQGESSDPVLLDGRETELVQHFPGKGLEVPVAVVAGRAPRGLEEIALGRHTLTALGKHIGDTVTLSAADRANQVATRTMRIVGTVILNSQGSDFDPGDGALVDSSPGVDARAFPGRYRVRFEDGVDPAAAAAALRAEFFDSTHYPATPPAVITNVQRVAHLPGVLAGVIIVLAVGTLAHGLATVLRRRRRELAIMKAVGFTDRQVLASVGWQATTISVVALIAGIPLGVALGRLAWRVVADALGVTSAAVVPWSTVAAVALATLLVVGAMALWAGRRTRTVRSAAVLRAE